MSALINAIKARIAAPPTILNEAIYTESPVRPKDRPAPPQARRSGQVTARNDSARRLMLLGDLIRDVPVEGSDADIVHDVLPWSIGRFDHLSTPVSTTIHAVASPKGEAV